MARGTDTAPDATFVAERWCLVCGSDHGASRRCPGEVAATGPERHAWRVNVQSERGFEAHGVLIAPVGDRWRARILTYPNVMWVVPGGGQSLKIVARSEAEVERRARELIRQHCLDRGYTLRDELVPVQPDELPPRFTHPQEAPRFRRALPVRYGLDLPRELGSTRDVSETGMFVKTDRPLAAARELGLLLQLEHCTLPLRGSVIWTRDEPRQNRPKGMGLRLISPPEGYVRYVRALG